MGGIFDTIAEGIAQDPVIAIGNIIALSFIVPLVSFIWRYARRSPWWVTDLGVALLAQKIAFVAIFVLIDVGLFFHDWPGRAALRLVLYMVVAVSLWLDQVNLQRYQAKGHYDRARFPRPPLWVIVRAQFTGEDLTKWTPGAPR
jgi:hypothetical protein